MVLRASGFNLQWRERQWGQQLHHVQSRLLEVGKTYRIIGRFGYADWWPHLDPAYNYAWDIETQTKSIAMGPNAKNKSFQRHNNDNDVLADKTGRSHEFSRKAFGFWLYELTGVPGGPSHGALEIKVRPRNVVGDIDDHVEWNLLRQHLD